MTYVTSSSGAAQPRFLLRLGKVLIVMALLIWVTATVLLNIYARSTIEKQISMTLGQPVTVGGIHAGWNFLRPTVALSNVFIGAEQKTGVEIGGLEGGIYLQRPKTGDDSTDRLYYAAVSGLKVSGKDWGDYEAQVKVPSGTKAVIPELKGKLGDAKLKGKLSVDVKSGWSADIDVENLDYSVIAAGVKGGDSHVDLSLTGITTPTEEIVRSVAGRVTLIGGKGSLEGNTLNLWAGSLLTAFLPGQSRDTHLNCAVADFDVKHGVAQARTVIIDTDKATITGTGKVDFVRGRIDMRFSPRPKGAALLNLATPVIVSGPFEHITTRPEAVGVAEKFGGFVLTAIAPPVALLPLLTGMRAGNPCQQFLDRKTRP
jgi:uncharacterized protein involved in outer membrane biogenesis